MTLRDNAQKPHWPQVRDARCTTGRSRRSATPSRRRRGVCPSAWLLIGVLLLAHPWLSAAQTVTGANIP